MLVIVVRIDTFPVLVPIEASNPIVVTARKHVWQSWVHKNVSDEVCVIYDRFELLAGVIIVDAELVVVRANNNPLLAGNELCTSDWSVCDFERLDLALLAVVKDDGCSRVQGNQDPGQSGM